MTLYHGSPVGGLTELKPFLSEHGKPYIYFASNPLVALLYAVKPVPKPFSFYPYGFNKYGAVVFSEYYENAFYDIYKNKEGYLYSCAAPHGITNPTQINCAYTCTEAVKPDEVTKIPDLYEFFLQEKKKGSFIIKTRREISDKEMDFVFSELKHDMDKYNLKNDPGHAMSVFIRTHFPNVWIRNYTKKAFR